jgi:biopolymer transport protein ExbD
MVDVLLIMLVFFMVTSTYLDLDMLPLAGGGVGGEAPSNSVAVRRLLVRIDAQGRIDVRGGGDLAALVAAERARHADLEIILLPSGQADVQALASTIESLIAAGATRIRIVRLEPQA